MTLVQNTPLPSNFIKDFPSVHAVNMDALDSFAGPCLTSHPLQTYTPQLTALTSNPVLGTGGLIRGFYYTIFDQVFTWGEFKFGTSGINVGSSTYLISLPFIANSVLGANTNLAKAPVVGNGFTFDNDLATTRQPVTAHLRTTSLLMFALKMDNGTGRVLAHNNPVAWAVNDGFMWSARYKRVV